MSEAKTNGFHEENVVNIDTLKSICEDILKSNHSTIQLKYCGGRGSDPIQFDYLEKLLEIVEFKTDGTLKNFPNLPLAEESRQNCRDMKLAILNVLAIFGGVTPEILSTKITFDTVGGDLNDKTEASQTNGPGEVSLSVPLYDITSDALNQSDKTVEFEKFDLIIDVRTPKEFKDDHIPGAVNMPVLNDEERHNVGATYAGDARSGREFGATIICRSIANLIEKEFMEKPRNSKILVYCWRGGLRSKSLAVIMKQIQFNDVKLLKGGYKNFRTHVMSSMPTMINSYEYMVLGGSTGSGKSLILECMREKGENVFHLEEIANHKGSVLGELGENNTDGGAYYQPSQKMFETSLWNALRKFEPGRKIWIEKEGGKIGNKNLPKELNEKIRNSPTLYLNVNMDTRLNFLLRDYEHHTKDPDLLCKQLDRLAKIAGKKLVIEWKEMIKEKKFRSLVKSLLIEHYDKLYDSTYRNGTEWNPKTKESADHIGQDLNWPCDLELEREAILNSDVLDQIRNTTFGK